MVHAVSAARDFEITWAWQGQELGRKTLACPDLDAAVTAAWLEMPDIARAARKPCSTITLRDTQSGHSITEDVPHDPPRTIWTAPLFYLAGGAGALFIVIWMGRHGLLAGAPSKFVIYAMLAFPFSLTFAILSFGLQYERNRLDAEQWKKDFGDVLPPVFSAPHRLHRVVVAHQSIWRALLALVIGLGFTWVCFWFPLDARLHGNGWSLWHPVLMAFGAWLLILSLVPLYQLLFRGGAALWIEGGEIVHVHRRFLSRPIWGLTGVAEGYFKPERGFGFNAILITDKDGHEEPLRPGYAEDTDLVIARLRSLLRLTPP